MNINVRAWLIRKSFRVWDPATNAPIDASALPHGNTRASIQLWQASRSCHSTALFAFDSDRVRFVDDQAGVMLLAKRNELRKGRVIPIHTENAFHDNDLLPGSVLSA